MSITVDWVQGETLPRKFKMKDGNGPILLTGMTVAVVVTKKDGVTQVDTTNDVTVTDAVNGIVQYTPKAAALNATDSPLTARWKLTDSTGHNGYLPEGEPDVWTVRKL